MLINEIFNTKADINWRQSSSGYRGLFTLDGHTYVIHGDEYALQLPSKPESSLLDVGFTIRTESGENWKPSNLNKNAAKVLGIVKNGIYELIQRIKPDIILFGAHYKNEDARTRISIYTRIAKMLAKPNGWYIKEAIKTTNGEYIMVSTFNFTKEDNEVIDNFAKQVLLKQDIQ